MASDRTAELHQATRIAFEHHQAGRLSEAERMYRHVLTADPSHPAALHYLGLLAHQVGRNDTAVELISKSLQHNPSNPSACNNLGMALSDLGRLQEAEQSYRRALAQKPDYPEALHNLGNVLNALGHAEEAERHYRRALEMRPDTAVTYNGLGKVLTDLGRHEEAERSIRKALELVPDYPEAHNALGTLFQRRGLPEEAARYYRRALELKPRFTEAHNNLALTLKACGLLNEAEKHYRMALEVDPGSVGTLVNLGALLHERGSSEEAQERFRRALELKPDDAAARWSLAIAQLPIIPESQVTSEKGRAVFASELSNLNDWFDAARTKQGYKAVGIQQPFYLAYQEANNRDLLSQYGQLCTRLMQHWQREQRFPILPPATGNVIRVGVVSAHVQDHSVWNALIKGWFRHVDRRRVSLHLFALDPKHDQETAHARTLTPYFDIGSRSLSRWVETILGQQLDALIFPEVGMDPDTIKLASLRLVPVQIASWGHPETTGLPTIDYFLSAEDFEPTNAHENYTEHLVRLPNLGCCYSSAPVEVAMPDLASMGIDPKVPLLVCPGTPFKYAPEYDWVFTAIARQLGRCQFIFFNDARNGLSLKLRTRLERAFSQARLNFADHVVFIPWQPRQAFYGLMKRAHVYLDTIGFSGFNSAMQAVECGLPIIAREGRFMRGRLASGILKRMGLLELVAASEEEYVALATNLATKSEYREQIRQRIESNRRVLYEDLAPIRAMEDFLASVTRKRSLSVNTEA